MCEICTKMCEKIFVKWSEICRKCKKYQKYYLKNGGKIILKGLCENLSEIFQNLKRIMGTFSKSMQNKL